MEILIFAIIEAIFYLLFGFLVSFFGYALTKSALILLIVSLVISIPPFVFMHFCKNQKKYVVISAIYLIATSVLFYLFGESVLQFLGLKSGITNFAMYSYKILYMLFPFTFLLFVLFHKLYWDNKKKQLYIIIALKRFLPIIAILLTFKFASFSACLYIFSICDFALNIIFPLVIFRKNA